MWSAWAYMETEIWAELREHEFDDEHAKTDHPTGDVTDKLAALRIQFPKNIVEGLVRGMWTRIKLDSRVVKSARRMFVENAATAQDILELCRCRCTLVEIPRFCGGSGRAARDSR